jgi:hypothetical protein
MSAPSPFTVVVDGFVHLVDTWTGMVGDHARGVAQQVDTGTFDADAATNAFARCTALSLFGWVALANEMLDAAAVLSNPPATQRTITSGGFETAASSETRSLQLDGPLVSGAGTLLPASKVSVEPSPLAPGQTTFELVATITNESAGIYTGKVQVTRSDSGAVLEVVDVYLMVP